VKNKDKKQFGVELQDLKRFCVIDVGSTTTKVILFTRDPEWQFYRREAPTTVEKPSEDVTLGVASALRELERLTGEILLRDGIPALPVLSTSSAGGGLAIVVAGLVGHVTSKSAARVALGAGAMIQDVLALDDGRTPYKKIEMLETLRPDMLLLAGGFDGGAVSGPVFLAELFNQANLRPKLSPTGKLPVIYAGNIDAQKYVAEILSDRFIYHPVRNLRPGQKRENLEPARHAIHEVFMDHVMSRAPGYERYCEWVSAPILPTPTAVSDLLTLVSRNMQAKILAVDIGGATTDVFSAENGEVFRTVSANLGMSYSILNVIRQAGLENIRELLDFEISETDLLDRIGNKSLQPTSLPRTVEDAKIECAVAAVAIREAVRDHVRVRKGFSISRGEEELSWHYLTGKEAKKTDVTCPSVADYDLIIGSGGMLSHSPRETAAMILLHALQPVEPVALAVDSVFMFPHLGVLSHQSPELALELFYKLGLVRLGKLIAPGAKIKPNSDAVTITAETGISRSIHETVKAGTIKFLYLDPGEHATLNLKPHKLKLKTRSIELRAEDGALIIDARGRPPDPGGGFRMPDDYSPPCREIEAPRQSKIERGRIRIRRELAIKGNVLVKPGDAVVSETVIAKSTQTFLRPFFLRVADKLRITPEDLPSVLKKNVGDEISAHEILAEKDARFRGATPFRSPVSGTIEKILPNGTVIVREKLEYMAKSYTVEAARDLSVAPDQLGRWMRCAVGDDVEQDQCIAAIGFGTHKRKTSYSPVRGKIKEINLDYGVVIITPLLAELQLTAWMPGTVEEITDKGCVILNKGTTINCAWGHGGQVSGILTNECDVSRRIGFREMTTAKDLRALESTGITALITGGLNLKAFEEHPPGFAIVVSEGFGDMPMAPEIYDRLTAHEGMIAVVDATTQLRAGVIRPRVILPE